MNPIYLITTDKSTSIQFKLQGKTATPQSLHAGLYPARSTSAAMPSASDLHLSSAVASTCDNIYTNPAAGAFAFLFAERLEYPVLAII